MKKKVDTKINENKTLKINQNENNNNKNTNIQANRYYNFKKLSILATVLLIVFIGVRMNSQKLHIFTYKS